MAATGTEIESHWTGVGLGPTPVGHKGRFGEHRKVPLVRVKVWVKVRVRVRVWVRVRARVRVRPRVSAP